MEHITVRPIHGAVLRLCDEGRFKDAIDFERDMGAEGDSDAPDVLAIRAETALYLDRFDEVDELLARMPRDLANQLRDGGPVGALARRVQLIAAGCEYGRGLFDACVEIAEGVALAANAVGDTVSEMRAEYDLGRAHRRAGRTADAQEHLSNAHLMSGVTRNDFYRGLVAFNRALLADLADDAARTRMRALEAMDLLGRSEGLRYAALCENFYGGFLCDLGEVEQGEALSRNAEQVAFNLGVMEDAFRAGLSRARALLSLRRYTEAAGAIRQHIALEEPARNSELQFKARHLLSAACYGAGDFAGSEASANAALQTALLRANDRDRVLAKVYMLRASARVDGSGPAAQELATLREQGRPHEGFAHFNVTVCLAGAVLPTNPLEARALCAEARAMKESAFAGWVGVELARVEEDLERSPVRVNADGDLVISHRLAWPSRRLAQEQLDRWIFDAAMAAADGNGAAAGRLIGESRYNMFALGRYVRGEAPRPSRGKAGPDAAPKKRTFRRA